MQLINQSMYDLVTNLLCAVSCISCMYASIGCLVHALVWAVQQKPCVWSVCRHLLDKLVEKLAEREVTSEEETKCSAHTFDLLVVWPIFAYNHALLLSQQIFLISSRLNGGYTLALSLSLCTSFFTTTLSVLSISFSSFLTVVIVTCYTNSETAYTVQ